MIFYLYWRLLYFTITVATTPIHHMDSIYSFGRCVCVCERVCVCVCYLHRQRGVWQQIKTAPTAAVSSGQCVGTAQSEMKNPLTHHTLVPTWCVCVCVCVRESERKSVHLLLLNRSHPPVFPSRGWEGGREGEYSRSSHPWPLQRSLHISHESATHSPQTVVLLSVCLLSIDWFVAWSLRHPRPRSLIPPCALLHVIVIARGTFSGGEVAMTAAASGPERYLNLLGHI